MPTSADTASSARAEWAYSFHSLPSRVVAAWVPLLVSLAAAALLILASASKATSVHVGAILLSCVLVGVVAARVRRMGVWATQTEVTVRNFFGTYEFSWADVSKVRAVAFGRYRAWVFEMRDGRGVGATCLPIRGVYGATKRLAAASASPVEVDTGGSKPDDG